MFLSAVIGIFILSGVLALVSLKKEKRKTNQQVLAEKELAKSKVLFYHSSSSSEENSRVFADKDK